MSTFPTRVLVLFALGSFAWVGFACDCAPPPPPKEALAKSAAVFLAKVVQIEDAGTGELGRSVTLSVERWWKGGETANLVVSTAKSGATCGYGFQKDRRYLVYAYSDGKKLTVSLCSRTNPAEVAEKLGDFKDLGEGQAAVKK